MHILIIEDEIPAFEKLRACLTIYFQNSFSYDWGRSVSESRHFLQSDRNYGLIISDIKLLDGLVFEVFDTLSLSTPIVFCSAYDEYLFKAFQSNGIAYILKPYTQEELAIALDKHNMLFSANRTIMTSDVLKELKSSMRFESNRYKSQFVIKTTQGIHLLNTNDVAYIEAQGDFCKMIDHKAQTHLYSQNIGRIYASLDPQKFFRVNRSAVVQLACIENIENYFKNRLRLTISGVSTAVITSSSTTADFRLWLDR